MVRRSDQDIVKMLAEYLINSSGVITQGEICSALKINSETAKKWLEIGLIFKNQCPNYEYFVAGKFNLVKVKNTENIKETQKNKG